MKKILIILLPLILASCASYTPLKAPCPNYGDKCSQLNINTWNN
jgi:hypothetical protein